jgi:hypothetical protein
LRWPISSEDKDDSEAACAFHLPGDEVRLPTGSGIAVSVDELKRPSSAAAAAACCALIAARWDGSAGASVLLGSSNLAVPAIVCLG